MTNGEARASRIHGLFAAAIVVGLALLGTAPRSFAQAEECLVEVNDHGGAITDGATLCAEASNKRCTFDLQICLNQAGCTPAELKGKKVKAKGHCGPVGRLFAPVPSGTGSACGGFTGITVRTKKNGKREGKCTIRVVAKSKTKPARKDLDKINLVCKPNAGDCPSTTTTTIATSSTTTTTMFTPSCDCCSKTRTQFTTSAPSSTETGTVKSTGSCVGGPTPGAACEADSACDPGTCTGPPLVNLSLTAGGLYFGGNGTAVPLPNQVPDQGLSILKLQNCNPATGGFDLAATVEADVGADPNPWRRCTSGPSVVNQEYPGKPGCLFGPPLPIPNGLTSVCVINRVSADATGSGTCGGATNNLALPLSSDLYLTGPALGDAPCPRCIAGGGGCAGSTLCCESGPNQGIACAPGTSLSGTSYPTSHDCPPPAPFIGSLPIPFNLSTGTQQKIGADFMAMKQVFCGFCGQSSGSTPTAFRGVCNGGAQNGSVCNTSSGLGACVSGGGSCQATACTSDAECSAFTTGCGSSGTSPCNRCRQRSAGAFGGGGRTITETGAPPPPNTCILSGTHDANLVSVFCIPPSFDGTVDANGDLPGPGAVSLPGKLEMLP